MLDKFWMCYVQDSDGCKVRHINRTEAMEEAERLSRLPSNAGKKVYLLVVVGYVSYEPMPLKWKNLYELLEKEF